MVEELLKELNLELPEIPKPIASYVLCKKTGSLLFVSGQGPVINGKSIYKGKIGRNLTKEEGFDAARLTALNILSIVKNEIGNLEKVKQIVTIHGFVNSTDDFNEQPYVINGASDILVRLFGERGRHARFALSCNSLPMNLPVEIEAIFEVEN